MSDATPIPIVGGPHDGQTYPLTSARWLCIPDGRERRRYVDDDGHYFTIYGKHTYEQRLRIHSPSSQQDRSWVWVSYQAPDCTAFTDWPAVEKRLAAATLGFVQ